MFLTIHEPIAESVGSFIESLKVGGSTAIIGMIIVFAVLAIIFAALILMRNVFAAKKKDAPAPEIPAAPVPAPMPEAEPTPASDDTAIVAAIIAAISAHTGKAPTSFRVVSFKRRR